MPQYEVSTFLNAAIALAGSVVCIFTLRPVAFCFPRIAAFLLVVQRRRIVGAISAVLGNIILLAFLMALCLIIVRRYFLIHNKQFWKGKPTKMKPTLKHGDLKKFVAKT